MVLAGVIKCLENTSEYVNQPLNSYSYVPVCALIKR